MCSAVYLCVSVCACIGDVVGGVDVVGGEDVVGVGAPLSLLLVDAVSLALGEVEEVLHCLQVDQQRLRGSADVLLLAKDL